MGVKSRDLMLFEECGSRVKEQYFEGKPRTRKRVCARVYVCACTDVLFKDRYTSKYVKERGKVHLVKRYKHQTKVNSKRD